MSDATVERYLEARALGATPCEACGHRLDLHDPPRNSHRPGFCGGDYGRANERCDCREFAAGRVEVSQTHQDVAKATNGSAL